MADRISREKRSWNMSRIRGKNTAPEMMVRSLLHRMGLRFRIHGRALPGCPDIVLSRWRTVVFVHGCFWHRHKSCHLSYTPRSREEFWARKFRDNVRRDRLAIRALANLGWRVLVVWECELQDMAQVKQNLEASFQP